MVPVASRGVSRAPRYSGTRVRVRLAFAEVAITPYGRLFQVVWLAAGLVTLRFYTDARPTTPDAPLRPQIPNSRLQAEISKERLVWASSAFARRYSRNRGCFIFLQVLRWFTSLG